MDRIDRRILAALQVDSSQSMAELGEKVGLSLSACHRRVKMLEAEGVISGYMARLDRLKLGLEMQAFVEIKFGWQDRKALEDFQATVMAMDEVIECHMISGDFDVLLRIAASGPLAFEKIYRDRLSELPGVIQTRTLLSMSTLKPFQGYHIETTPPA